MPDSQYTWWTFIKKIGEFIAFIFSFFRGRKQEQQQRQREKFDKTSNDIKEGYNKIDKEKDTPKDDLDKRLKNLF